MRSKLHAVRRAAFMAAALICVLAVPRLAHAAYAQCADSLASSGTAADLGITALDDELLDEIDIIDNEKAPPISLTEGASAVAPQPIVGPSDARIEAAKRCQNDVSRDELSSSPEDAPLQPPSSVMAADLPGGIELPTVTVRDQVAPILRSTVPARGVRRGLYRPPQR
jgi:hypothetical protein